MCNAQASLLFSAASQKLVTRLKEHDSAANAQIAVTTCTLEPLRKALG